MAPRIYESPIPAVPIYNHSIFTHLFASPSGDPSTIGGHPGEVTALVDAASGTAVTRAQLKHLALSFAHGIRHHGARRGDTVLIFSPNSLAWPLVLFGCKFEI